MKRETEREAEIKRQKDRRRSRQTDRGQIQTEMLIDREALRNRRLLGKQV